MSDQPDFWLLWKISAPSEHSARLPASGVPVVTREVARLLGLGMDPWPMSTTPVPIRRLVGIRSETPAVILRGLMPPSLPKETIRSQLRLEDGSWQTQPYFKGGWTSWALTPVRFKQPVPYMV